MGEFKFLKGLGKFLDGAAGANSTDEECITDINHYKFYQFALIPAFAVTLLLSATKSRRQKLLWFLNGRPGLIFPMDTLTRSSRISYCCAFGATGFLVYQILLDGKFAIDYTGPIALKTLIAVISMFIYGMVFFPVFTSLALGTALSYLVGSLYVWMFFVVEVYKVTECHFNMAGRAILLTRSLPSLICLTYLSLSMPAKFCVAIYNKKYWTPSLGEDPYNETIKEIQASYQGKHVRNILRKPKIDKPPEGLVNTVKAGISRMLSTWIYHNQSGFRYPSRLLSVMFVSICVVYVITLETLVTIVTLFDGMIDGYEISLDEIGREPAPNETDEITSFRFGIELAYEATQIFRTSLIVSFSVSCAISMLTILHMMSSFRTNLFAMYRGDYTHIPSPATKTAISLCTGSIKYAGFQVAYIVWAFIITCLILFIISLILATAIILLINGYTNWLVDRLLQIWPGVVIGLGLFGIQYLLAKYLFLQDRGQHLRLDNRRFYFVFVYFMFFYNIFLGLISCLLRIIKAIGVGTIFLARLDNSTLPRKFEFFDPGFNAYQGYIHMEAAHTHPVVNVFIRILVALSNSRRKQKNGDKGIEIPNLDLALDMDSFKLENGIDLPETRPVNVEARFHWHVTYTLLHNPMVRIYRKGFIQSIKMARKEGLMIPISDQPITDFDLVKAQQERDIQREENAKKSCSPSHSDSDCLSALGFMKGRDGDYGMKVEKYNEKKFRKCKLFKKLKKRSGSETSPENVSEEYALENENIKSCTKDINV